MGTLAVVSQVLLALAGIFLMIVVLLQRGRGGGLAGAFGGLGGQSAFGTKAGDVFTRITIVIAIIWVALAGGSGYFLRASSEEKGASSFQENVREDDGAEGAGALPDDGNLEVPVAPELPPLDDSSEADSTSDGSASPSPEPGGSAESADNPDPDAASATGPAGDSPSDESESPNEE